MIIGSTFLLHEKLRKFTWRSPDGNTTNHIDHVLVDAQHRNSVKDVRSRRGINTNSDHFLTVAIIHNRINKYCRYQKENELKWCDIDKLKDPENVRKYRSSLKVEVECGDQTIEIYNGNWTSCKHIITMSADEVIKEEGGRQKNY